MTPIHLTKLMISDLPHSGIFRGTTRGVDIKSVRTVRTTISCDWREWRGEYQVRHWTDPNISIETASLLAGKFQETESQKKEWIYLRAGVWSYNINLTGLVWLLKLFLYLVCTVLFDRLNFDICYKNLRDAYSIPAFEKKVG